MIGGSTSPRIALTNAGISQSLPDDAGVVGLLVVSFDSSENFLGSFRLHVGVELIGPRQEQGNQCLLVIGHDGQNVEANAFRKNRFIQEPVTLHLGERLGDTLH